MQRLYQSGNGFQVTRFIVFDGVGERDLQTNAGKKETISNGKIQSTQLILKISKKIMYSR
jgi:hypothetical protein